MEQSKIIISPSFFSSTWWSQRILLSQIFRKLSPNFHSRDIPTKCPCSSTFCLLFCSGIKCKNAAIWCISALQFCLFNKVFIIRDIFSLIRIKRRYWGIPQVHRLVCSDSVPYSQAHTRHSGISHQPTEVLLWLPDYGSCATLQILLWVKDAESNLTPRHFYLFMVIWYC